VYIVHRRGTVCALSLLFEPPKNDFTRTVQRLTVYEGRLEVVILKQLMKRKQRWKLPSPSLGHILI
jgi:ubiquitin-protein ligase